jgi:hypothetical protein
MPSRRRRVRSRPALSVACGALALAATARNAAAQEDYEIEVYRAVTQAPKSLMLELHSNYTFQGRKITEDGVAPTNHAEHETVEAVLGLTPWSEMGAYAFTSAGGGQGAALAGGSLRYRVRAPDAWAWPVGLSLSSEIGYMRPLFSEDGWTWEIRPIVDEYRGRWYLAVNPTFEWSLSAQNVVPGLRFTPSAKCTYDVTERVSAGFEYYAAPGEGAGAVSGFDIDTVVIPYHPPGISASRAVDNDAILHLPHGERQQLFATVDLHVSSRWEINVGVGLGTTGSTDHLVAKLILGRNFSWGPPNPGM